MQRRHFIGTALAAGVAGLTDLPKAAAQPVRLGAARRLVEVERLYKSPDTIPNALEAEPDGLWIADQVTERIHKVNYETGAVLHEVQSESHNTSGLGVGGGYLWTGANGAGTASQRREFNRPTDRAYGEIIQLDMETGRQIRAIRPQWQGGIHGVTYVNETNRLWAVMRGRFDGFAEMDPRDNFRILRMVGASADTAHGIDWWDDSLWVMYAGSRLAQRIDPSNSRVLETYELTPNDPDPHGMAIHDGYMYYSDAGLGGGRAPNPGAAPSFICRFKLS